jgi:hypothetical protein
MYSKKASHNGTDTKHMVPIIDRNPQKYVPNIFEATEKDFRPLPKNISFNANGITY